MNVKVSVALCTFNGEKYLNDQLNSIALQTVLPSEIIICDDCSTDKTLEIVKNLNCNFPIDIKVYKNDVNSGVTKNFEKAISKCVGDIVFLADQDDVWLKNKVEDTLAILCSSENIYGIFTNAYVVDDELKPMGYKLWNQYRFGKHEMLMFDRSRGFEVMMSGNRATGATMAIKREALQYVMPFSPNMLHDAWIASILSAINTLSFLEKETILYRQHGANQIGAYKLNFLERACLAVSIRRETCLAIRDQCNDIRARLMLKGCLNKEIDDELSRKSSHYLKRGELERGIINSLKIILRETASGNYNKYSNGISSAVVDFTKCVLQKTTLFTK